MDVLTIWRDGSFVRHHVRDAEIATLSEPDDVLVNIRLDTCEAVVFISSQDRVTLAEKLCPPPPTQPPKPWPNASRPPA